MSVLVSSIKCKVYIPMIGKVEYHDGEEGILHTVSLEDQYEIGSKYTICSPLSPYAIGWNNWKMLCEEARGKDFAEVFMQTLIGLKTQ